MTEEEIIRRIMMADPSSMYDRLGEYLETPAPHSVRGFAQHGKPYREAVIDAQMKEFTAHCDEERAALAALMRKK